MSFEMWVSDLDTVAYWRRSGGGMARLRRMLTERPEPDHRMLVGQAFHDGMQSGVVEESAMAETMLDRITGRDDHGREHVFDLQRTRANTMMAGARELRVRYEVDRRDIAIRGRVDAVAYDYLGSGPLHVCDYKVSFRAGAEERLERSWQWRAYLAATGAPIFRYEMVQLRRTPSITRHVVTSWRAMRQYAYPGLRRELNNHAIDIREIARKINWEGR